MNVNAIYANIRLALPDAARVEINKYLILAQNELNARGLERIFNVSAVLPEGEYDADPMARTEDQAFNYYPEIKCLILPSYCLHVEQAYYGSIKMAVMTTENVMAESISGYGFYITDIGEMYLSFALAAGDIIKVMGRVGGLTMVVLPDRYIPYFTYNALAGLYSQEYENPDMYAVYSRKAIEAERSAVMAHPVQAKNIARNGRLY